MTSDSMGDKRLNETEMTENRLHYFGNTRTTPEKHPKASMFVGSNLLLQACFTSPLMSYDAKYRRALGLISLCWSLWL